MGDGMKSIKVLTEDAVIIDGRLFQPMTHELSAQLTHCPVCKGAVGKPHDAGPRFYPRFGCGTCNVWFTSPALRPEGGDEE